MLNPSIRKVLDLGIGISLVVVGVLGLVLPFLPGWLCIVGGLAVLSSHSRWAKLLMDKLKGIGHAIRSKLSKP